MSGQARHAWKVALEPIRRAVVDVTQPNIPQHEAAAAETVLVSYLQDPLTLAAVYHALLDLGYAERKRCPAVVTAVVQLLKLYLLKYLPHPGTLRSIDIFCRSVGEELLRELRDGGSSSSHAALDARGTSRRQLVKSLQYIRAVIAPHVPLLYGHAGGAAGISAIDPIAYDWGAPGAGGGGGGVGRGGPREPVQPNNIRTALLEGLSAGGNNATISPRTKSMMASGGGQGDVARPAVTPVSPLAAHAGSLALRYLEDGCDMGEAVAWDLMLQRWGPRLGEGEGDVPVPAPGLLVLRPELGCQWRGSSIMGGTADLRHGSGGGSGMLDSQDSVLSDMVNASTEPSEAGSAVTAGGRQPSSTADSRDTSISDADSAPSGGASAAAAPGGGRVQGQISRRSSGSSTGFGGGHRSGGSGSSSRRRCVAVEDVAAAQEQIHCVAVAKARQWEAEAGLATAGEDGAPRWSSLGARGASIARGVGTAPLLPGGAHRRPSLFQYHFYSEQQPLSLSGDEINEVVALVTGGSGDGRDNRIACSILVKLLVDSYLAEPAAAAPLTFSLLADMLASPSPKTRVRAFDIVFNLVVHSYLLEPPVEPGYGSKDGRRSPMRPVSEELAVARLESWLFEILKEMLLLLVQNEEESDAVWASALSTLVFFTTRHGRILFRRFVGVDMRVLAALLRRSVQQAWVEDLHRHLVCITCNMLYAAPDNAGGGGGSGGLNVSVDEEGGLVSTPAFCTPRTYESDDFGERGSRLLDVDRLEQLGGISFVCQQYICASSSESRSSLFGVIFDFLVAELQPQPPEGGADAEEGGGSGRTAPGTDGEESAPLDDDSAWYEEEVQIVAQAFMAAGVTEVMAEAMALGVPGVCTPMAVAVLQLLDREVASRGMSREHCTHVAVTMLEGFEQLAVGQRAADLELLPQLQATLDGAEDDKSPVPACATLSLPGIAPVVPVPAFRASLTSGGQAIVPPLRVCDAWGNLRMLLHSKDPDARSSSEAWLFAVLVAHMGRRDVSQCHSSLPLLADYGVQPAPTTRDGAAGGPPSGKGSLRGSRSGSLRTLRGGPGYLGAGYPGKTPGVVLMEALSQAQAARAKRSRSEGAAPPEPLTPLACAGQLLEHLLHDPNPLVRRSYISIVERVLLLHVNVVGALLEAPSRSSPSSGSGAGVGSDGAPAGPRPFGHMAGEFVHIVNECLGPIVTAGETDENNLLLMCELLLRFLCVARRGTSSRKSSGNAPQPPNRRGSSTRRGSQQQGITMASRSIGTGCSGRIGSLFLQGKVSMPHDRLSWISLRLLHWPFSKLLACSKERAEASVSKLPGSMGGSISGSIGGTEGMLASGLGAGIPGGCEGYAGCNDNCSDMRSTLLLLLIGRCHIDRASSNALGGEAFFKELMEDTDPRVAYYASVFLLQRMRTESFYEYRKALLKLVVQAQKANDEHVVLNSFLQMRALLGAEERKS
eukprot:jgi/Mesvir1/858/Mv17429-RA.2